MAYRQFSDEELKWIRSFERVMGKAPKTLFMFVGNGIIIHTKDEENNRYTQNSIDGAMDRMSPSISIQTPMETDGGDY